MVSAQQIHSICPGASLDNIGKYTDAMNRAMIAYEINTRQRVCGFLSQVLHETQGLAKMRENTNYTSAKRLREVFPKYFTRITAEIYVGNPVAIASLVYANRMGNGPESSQDGWKYRGGGPLHATGKAMYDLISKQVSLDLVSKPELITEPIPGMYSAGYIWNIKGCNAFVDAGNLKGLRKAINGGFNGLQETIDLYERAMTVILK